MAVASAEAADWQIGRDSTVAERWTTPPTAKVLCRTMVLYKSQPRKKSPVAEHDPYEAFPHIEVHRR
jgi:hypothetical protein